MFIFMFIFIPLTRLDNNDDKCVSWWERVIVEGTTVRSLPKPVEPPNSDPCLNLDDVRHWLS